MIHFLGVNLGFCGLQKVKTGSFAVVTLYLRFLDGKIDSKANRRYCGLQKRRKSSLLKQ